MKIFIPFIMLFLFSCSHDFKGGRPDFTKTGSEAISEYEKFQIVSLHRNRAHMYGDETFDVTTVKSIKPLMKEISPTAYQAHKDLLPQAYVHAALVGSLFAFAIIGSNAADEDKAKWTGWYWGSAAALLGHGFYVGQRYQQVADKYNKDLKSKFSPALSFKQDF